MRMIKRSKKHSADKKGIILVTVLFILAMAMIFISCALLLTSATRSRVYDKAEASQARLTLTSAVESFYQAVQMQEIDDAHLIAAAQATPDDESKGWIDINMGTVNQVPGMRNTKDSKTQVRLVYKSGEQKVYATFRTTIGDARTEYAQLVLKEGEDEKYPDLFSAQVDYIGNAGNNFRASIGGGAPAGADDNFIVYRGNYRSNQSEHTTAYSDMLFLGKKNTPNVAYFENNEHMRGNLVFMDDYYYSWNSTCPDLDGNVFFLGAKGGSDAAFDSRKVTTDGDLEGGEPLGQASRSYAKNTQTWIFVNRKVSNTSNNAGNQFNAVKSAKQGIFLSASAYSGKPYSTKLKESGTWSESLYSNINSAGSSTFSGWKSAYDSDNGALKKASMYYTTDRSYLVKDYPTSGEMFSDYNIPRTSSEASGKGYTSKSLSEIVSEQHALNTTNSAKPLTSADGVSPLKLIIGGGTVTGVNKVDSGTAPKVVFLDGNIDTYLFVSSSLNLYNVIFAVVNANDKHHQFFIIGQGANLKLSEDDKWDGGIIGTGFLSIPRGYTAQGYYDAIKNGTFKMANSAATFGHKAPNKPTMNIYGMGNNQVEIKKGTIIEGYLGLFQPNYNTMDSKITITNITSSALFRFYGRIMATVVKNTSGDFDMPYCPGPGSKMTEEWPEYKSKYRALSVKYFYNTGESGS